MVPRMLGGVKSEASRTELRRLIEEDKDLSVRTSAILSLGDEWCVARRTAAVLLGLPLLGRAPTEVQLTRARSTSHEMNNHNPQIVIIKGENHFP